MRSAQAQIDLASGRLWSQLLRFKQEGFLLGAGRPSGSDVHISSSGIVQGHAYSLLQVREVDGHKLVQIRNPWANEVEWNGPWSDSSPEWTDRMKHKLKHVPRVCLLFMKTKYTKNFFCININAIHFSNRQGMVYFGCHGKISRFISDLYTFVVSILLRCDTRSTVNGEVIVLVVARIMTRGTKTRSSEYELLVQMHRVPYTCSLP